MIQDKNLSKTLVTGNGRQTGLILELVGLSTAFVQLSGSSRNDLESLKPEKAT